MLGRGAMLIERLATPHGAAVVVAVDDVEHALARLPAPEQQLARTLGELRRRDFVTGRTALHLALDDHETPILADDRGAPMLPRGWLGSVSHKAGLAAALVAPADAGGWVGLDLERAGPPRLDIARRILTDREQALLPALAADRGRAVTLRFAIKEAIYKAIDPYLRRYVGFLEVEVEVELEEHACRVTSPFPLAIEATWREHAGHWLATARATRTGG
jgi:4'-phosphopantetheinyl transferase EntD